VSAGGDSVDAIVAAWSRERPDLDVSPLTVLSRVSRLARHLDLARRDVFARHGLDPGEFDVLAALRRSGAPYEMSPGALAEETLVTSGTMTNRVDRLQSAGLIDRQRAVDDRRGVRVRLTDAGRERVDAALVDLLEVEQSLLAELTPAQSADLAAHLRVLVAPIERSRDQMRTTDRAERVSDSAHEA
jgi:DNA-binding MarR family transcriptional regulator